MKKIIACIVLGGLVASTAVLADSKIQNSNITVKSINKNSSTKAEAGLFGSGNANTGGVALDDSTIKDSTVTVKSNNKNAFTKAEKGAVANTGGLSAKDSKVLNSTVTIDSKNQNSTTTAEGSLFSGGTASTGGVTLR